MTTPHFGYRIYVDPCKQPYYNPAMLLDKDHPLNKGLSNFMASFMVPWWGGANGTAPPGTTRDLAGGWTFMAPSNDTTSGSSVPYQTVVNDKIMCRGWLGTYAWNNNLPLNFSQWNTVPGQETGRTMIHAGRMGSPLRDLNAFLSYVNYGGGAWRGGMLMFAMTSTNPKFFALQLGNSGSGNVEVLLQHSTIGFVRGHEVVCCGRYPKEACVYINLYNKDTRSRASNFNSVVSTQNPNCDYFSVRSQANGAVDESYIEYYKYWTRTLSDDDLFWAQEEPYCGLYTEASTFYSVPEFVFPWAMRRSQLLGGGLQ